MEKRTKKDRLRVCGPEDEEARIEGIFEEEIIDKNKRCLEIIQKDRNNLPEKACKK